MIGAVPIFLYEHPEGLTFDELVDLSISKKVAEWEAEHHGREQVEDDMAEARCLPRSQAYDFCITNGDLKPPLKERYLFGQKDKNSLRYPRETKHPLFQQSFAFIDWAYKDGRYFLSKNPEDKDKRRKVYVLELIDQSTRAEQFSFFAQMHGLTNTQYLRLFIPACVDEVMQKIKQKEDQEQ